MNKRMILSALLVICLLSALTACSKDKNEPLTGVYVIADLTDDPDGVTFEELSAMYKEMDLDVRDQFYFEFFDDAGFSLILFGQEEAAGTFTHEGNMLTLSDSNGETLTAEISGKIITWTYKTGAKLVFEKKT